MAQPFQVQNPANIVPTNGDKTNQVLIKYMNEFVANYAEHQNIATWYEGSTAPANPVTGQRWKDTSVSPSILRSYSGTAWVLDDLETKVGILTGGTIASSGTTDLSVNGTFFQIAGTETITNLGTAPLGTHKDVEFKDSLVLTNNNTSLILPARADILTSAGDTATFISLGGGNWICKEYQPAAYSQQTLFLLPDPKTIFIPTGALGMIHRETANKTYNYLYVDCCDSNFAPQNPTSFVLTIYQNGTLIYTSSAITTAATTATVALTISAGDLMRYVVSNTTGLTGGIAVSPRRVNR